MCFVLKWSLIVKRKHKGWYFVECSCCSVWNDVSGWGPASNFVWQTESFNKSYRFQKTWGWVNDERIGEFFWWIVPLSCPCENETFELCVIFKLFIMFVIVLCIIDDIVWNVLSRPYLVLWPPPQMPADSCLRVCAGLLDGGGWNERGTPSTEKEW